MKKVKTKSLEHFLKEIDEIKEKAAELNKFENNVDNLLKNFNNPESESFAWLENSPICTKIIDLDFNLKYMSKAGIEKLRIENISSHYGKPYPLSFYSNSFKIPMQECLEKAIKSKEINSNEASILDGDGNMLWFESTIIPIKNKEDNIDYIMIVSQDITERKNIELEIKNSQKFHKSLLQTSPDIIYVYDIINQKSIYNNNGNLKVLGYSKEDIHAFDSDLLSTIMHPDDYKNFVNNVLPKYNKLKDGEIIELEYRFKHKNGNWIWLHSRESIFKRIDGIPIQIIGVAGNITDRKRIELDLKHSQEKLKEALEITQLGTFVFNDSTNLFETSAISDSILGIDKTYKRDPQGWKNLVHPNDIENAQNLLDDPSTSYVSSEFRIIRPIDKKIIWISGFVKKEFDNKGNRIKIIGTLQDISKRKETQEKLKLTEEYLKSTFNLSPSIISSVNIATGYFTNANEAVTRILGYSVKEFISKPFIELIHPDDLEKTSNAVSKKLSGNNVASFENRYLCKDGSYKWIAWQGTLPDENGIITAIGSDISDKKKVEEDLKKSLEELENYRQQLETENILLKKEMSLSFNFEDMVYTSSKMSDVLTMVEQVARTDANVLILGETGTGKELIAKAIHKISNRKNNSLISINCGAIPSELIESELFGHVKGAFTGAINNRLGKFELADGGTLFLDEIGEMPLSLQPKLLRAIQEGEIEPIGSSKLKKLDVRIIAATNKDLKKETKEKRFREDLYFRLNVFPINIPPLRERIDDIAVLIEFFVNKYSKKHNKQIEYISDITLQQLKYYKWPGNVRELENLIERAIILSNSNILVMPEFETDSINKISSINGHRITLDQAQKDHILKTLNDTNWKIDGKEGAAKLLDIKPSTLRDRMKKLGIERP
jgi:PAS domain S-box-containing protein